MKGNILNIKNKIMELYKEYFGFFILTITLTWVKTYVSYHLEFSLGVKGILQHFILLINPIGITILMFSLCLFRKSQKQRYKTLMIIYIINTLLLYSNVIYYREFSDFLTFNIVSGLKDVSGDTSITSSLSTFFSLTKWYDFVYWVDVIILFAIGRKRDSVFIAKDKKMLRKKQNNFKLIKVGIVILLVNIAMAEISRPLLLTRTFDRNYIVKYLGINGFTVYDAIKTAAAAPGQGPPSEEDIIKVLDYRQDNYVKPNEETFGIAKGRNVIAIHMESIEQFLIDYSFIDENGKGWEVIPFLNSLYHHEDTFAFPNIFGQIGQGKSSDAELMMETSLFGLDNGAAFIDKAENTYNSIAKILKDKEDYTSAAFHGNVGSFWNRTDMYVGLGYDYFFDADDFVLTEENTAEYGLKDKLFFLQSSKYIEQLQQPFYTKFMTLSNHFPFPYDEKNSDIPRANTNNATIDGYFATSNYADQALEEFFKYLKSVGLYDNSIFVLYGDHQAIAEFRTKKLAPLLDRDPKSWTEFDDLHKQRVPLIIHIPGYGQGDVIDTYGGQIDIMPTLLNLLGINTQSHFLMGQDLLSKDKNETIAFRNGDIVTPEYTIISDNIYNTRTRQIIDEDQAYYDVAIKLKQEAHDQLRVSDKILGTDFLNYYRKPGFVPIDNSNIDYSNDWDRLLEEANKAGKDNTSLYYMNGGKPTFGLYKTDAPELVDTLKKMKEAKLAEENQD